jgi:serine/threonine protein kinase
METHSACPAVESLKRYASGCTSDAESQRLEEHLRGCPPCLARLSTVGESDGLMQALRAQKNNPRPKGAALDRLQEQLRNLVLPATKVQILETDSSGLDITHPPGDHFATDEDLGSLLSQGQRPDEIGRLGSYRVLRVLGRGGMGIVFEAEDPQLQRRVALKAIRPDLAANTAARQRFLREAQRMAALTHDHILAIHHIGEDRSILFLAMPLLQGESLDDRLRREGQLPVAEVLRIGRETAQGLAAAHERGVIHRDVKPANLWLEAPTGRVKILDFGLARLAQGDTALTGSLAIVGTPMYMAPEQAEGKADSRADLFSLGCVLYRMVTGRLAFSGETLAAVVFAVTSLKPPSPRQINPQVPERLSQLIERLLFKDRADRPASAADVVRELEEIVRAELVCGSAGRAEAISDEGDAKRPLEGSPSSTPVPSTPTRTPGETSLSRRRLWQRFPRGPLRGLRPSETSLSRRRLAAAGLLLAGALGVAAFALWHGPSTPTGMAPRSQKTQIQIQRLDVEHYLTVHGRRDPRPRLLGKDSFVTYCNDGVEVEARLSQPAYAFLIAFRPDGTEVLCLPEKPDKAPTPTEWLLFPPTAENDYGLEEGTGLQAFVLVASSQPLPSFQQWWSHQGCPWQKSEAPPDVVWRSLDGIQFEGLTADSSGSRGQREVPGKASVARLTHWLKGRPQVEAVAVLGFAVMPTGKP